MLWVYKFNDTLSERRIFSIFDALNAGFIGASLPNPDRIKDEDLDVELHKNLCD